MHYQKNQFHKSGFTLVELSIVLVIIGLLISGILIGQSLITSSKVNSAIQQIGQFDSAINSFKAKYKQLPGDTLLFGPVADNDGFIEDHYASCCAQPTIFRSEVLNFWPHLQTNGLKIQGISNALPIYTAAYASTNISVAKGTQNVPKMNIGENTGIIPYATGANFAAGTTPFTSGTIQVAEATPRANYYFLADFSTMSSGVISSGGNSVRGWTESIPVELAQAVDSKLDDGKINTGRVLNGSYYNTGCSITTTNSAYDVVGGKNCALIIRMLN